MLKHTLLAPIVLAILFTVVLTVTVGNTPARFPVPGKEILFIFLSGAVK